MNNINSQITTVSTQEKIAVGLDVESVLANTQEVLIKQYNEEFGTNYEVSDIDKWEWVRTEIDWGDFDRILHTAWAEDTNTIDPKEENLGETVQRLVSSPKISLDVITGRTGVENEMQEWLATNGIDCYREFISTTRSKATFDYDVYIDDKPGLAENLSESQIQYLIEGPHNTSAVSHPRTIPVETVSNATAHLLDSIEG